MTRHVPLEGVENFRDFGGYDTACGRGMKTGVLYRSAAHSKATDTDLQRMRDLGLAVIVDLRRATERQRDPSRRWDGFEADVIENDIESEHPDWEVQLKGADLTPEYFLADSVQFYRHAPFEARHIDLFSRYFKALADSPGPLVVHCAAGKDRTGMICALTHHIAGVHADDRMADFLATNNPERIESRADFLGGWIAEHVGLTPSREALRVAVGVHPSYLDAAWAAMSEAHGSIDGYLEARLGVDAALRERIAERILKA
jgi:protein tyrosine/serine phosphatase